MRVAVAIVLPWSSVAAAFPLPARSRLLRAARMTKRTRTLPTITMVRRRLHQEVRPGVIETDSDGWAGGKCGVLAVSGAGGFGASAGNAIGGCDGEDVAAPESARAKSPTRANRSAGFLASPRSKAASTFGARGTPIAFGTGTGLWTCAISAESGLSDGNGCRPTSIWYATMAIAY
jgi:hypothetical protein